MTTFEVGRVAEIDKDNATHSTHVGQFLCVTSVSSDKKKADVEIFDSEADALAKAADVLGTGTGVGATACVKKLSQVARATISNLTSKVDDAMAPAPPPPSPYHGKVVKDMSVPLLSASGAYQGVAIVDVTVSHVSGAFAYEFMHSGTRYNLVTDEAQVKAALGLTPPTTYPVKLSPVLNGPVLIAALKQCAGSKTLADANEVCASELSDVLCAAGIISTGDVDHTTVDGRLQLTGVATIVKSTLAGTTLAPGLAPGAIGDAVKQAMAALRGAARPPPPPPTPHANADAWQDTLDDFAVPRQCKMMAKLAVSEDAFRKFLADSVSITVKASLLAWAQGYVKAQLGALERMLNKAANHGVDLTGLGRAKSMSGAQLMGELTNMQMAIEDDGGRSGIGNGNLEQSEGQRVPSGTSIWSELSSTSAGMDETERRERQVLRADMEKLAASKDGMASLQELDDLRQGGDMPLMMKQISELENASLKRLIHSAGDVSTALAGLRDARPLDMLVNLRSALERRIERCLYGDKDLPAERVTKAIRAIRLGNLSQLKLLHVLDRDDCGTATEPLKQLEKLGGDGAAVLSQAIGRISTIVQLSHPTISYPAMLFFNKLASRITALHNRGATWSNLGTWLSKIMRLVARPQRSFSFGERSAGGLLMDIELITQVSEYNEDIEDAIRNNSRGGASQEGAPNAQLRGDKDDDMKRLKRRATLAEQALAQERKKNGRQDDEADAKQPASNKRPKKGSKEMDDWNDNNKIGGKPRCWDDGNGGCKRGAKCHFPHKK